MAMGNPGHRALNIEEPYVREGEPTMPAGMSPGARRVWRATVAEMLNTPGLLSLLDGAVLADYCEVRADKDALQHARSIAIKRAIDEARAKAVGVDVEGLPAKLAEMKAAGEKVPTVSTTELRAEVIQKYGSHLNTLRHRENVLRWELGWRGDPRPTGR